MMNETSPCPLEDEVLAAAMSGAGAESFADHLEECASCADAVLAHAFLGAGAAALAATAPLPGAEAVLRRAARRDRERALARSQLPIRIAQRFAVVAGAVGAALAAVRLGPAAWDGLASLGSVAASHPQASAGPLLAIGAVLLSALVIGIFTSWQAAE